MTKNELIESLQKVKGNPKIYLSVANNNYKIRQIVSMSDRILLNTYSIEDVENPEEELEYLSDGPDVA